MKSFGSRHYVPILIAKPAELKALKSIPLRDSIGLTPLFALPSDAQASSIAKLPQALADNWTGGAAFIDGQFVPALTFAGVHSLEWLVSEAGKRGIELVPSIALGSPSVYIQAVKSILEMSTTSGELAIRLEKSQWKQLSGSSGELGRLIYRLGVDRGDVHLILDAKGKTRPKDYKVLKKTLSDSRNTSGWKTLTSAATSMPKTISSDKGVILQRRRQEWQNYIKISAASDTARYPAFGDYGVGHHGRPDVLDPTKIMISAKLKYTGESQWLLERGGLFKGNRRNPGVGGQAILPIVKDFLSHPDFSNGHCPMEDWMLDVASTGKQTGNPAKWLELATHHHLLRVLGQL